MFQHQKPIINTPINHTTMKGKTPIIILLVLLSTTTYNYSQETITLDLQKSIEIAKEKSHNMLMLQEELKIAEYRLKIAKNKFKTNIVLNIKAPNYVETIVSDDVGEGTYYFPKKKLSYSSDLEINQPLPTDGRVYIRSGVYNEDDFYRDTNNLNLHTRIGLSQPIEAFYSYNGIQAEFKRANLNYELSQKNLQRAELNLIYNVSQSFYALLSAQESMEIAKSDLERQKSASEIASNKYTAGLIRESDALQMEIDLGAAYNSYDIAIAKNESQINNLKQQLGLSMQDSISITGNYEYKEVLVDVEQAVQLGLDNRMEVRQREIEIELSDINIKKAKSQRYVQGEITAYYDFTGYGYNNFGTPAFENALEDMQNRPGNRGIALNIHIPILDWGVNKSQQRVAEASKQKNRYALELEKVNIEKEIRNTVNNLHSSLNRLKLLERNVELAEKNFEISRARFSNGDIDAQTLALDRDRLNKAFKSRLDAYISYKLLLADLNRKTFYDFEKNIGISQ